VSAVNANTDRAYFANRAIYQLFRTIFEGWRCSRFLRWQRMVRVRSLPQGSELPRLDTEKVYTADEVALIRLPRRSGAAHRSYGFGAHTHVVQGAVTPIEPNLQPTLQQGLTAYHQPADWAAKEIRLGGSGVCDPGTSHAQRSGCDVIAPLCHTDRDEVADVLCSAAALPNASSTTVSQHGVAHTDGHEWLKAASVASCFRRAG